MWEYLRYFGKDLSYHHFTTLEPIDSFYQVREVEPFFDEQFLIWPSDFNQIDNNVYFRVNFGENKQCYLLERALLESVWMVFLKLNELEFEEAAYFETEDDAYNFVSKL